jgi:hypothetical protein
MPKRRIKNPDVPELWKPIKQESWKKGEPVKELGKRFQRVSRAFQERRAEWLDAYENYFEKTESPLFAWDAYLLARKNNLPVPEWILRYFDGVAAGLLNTENSLKDCALHLGFVLKDGGPGPFKQYRNTQMKLTAISYVLNLLHESPELKVDDACDKAVAVVEGRWGRTINAETIKRWYYQLE